MSERDERTTTNERLSLAEHLLREAVFAARAAQSAGLALRGGGGNCGLGERAGALAGGSDERAGSLSDLSPRSQELCAQLWPTGVSDASALRSALQDWIERQDALDRKRNHFLKAFRHEHGFDRTRYTAEQTRAFEEGLARINAEEDRLRSAAAAALPGV